MFSEFGVKCCELHIYSLTSDLLCGATVSGAGYVLRRADELKVYHFWEN